MKIAECRMSDPACVNSRRLANFVVTMASAGKSREAVRKELLKFAAAPENLLDDPIKIATDGDPVRGPASAKVTIVEFSDFQCPYCAKAAAEVKQILNKYPKDVRLIFKQFPLDIHSQAAVAAEASLAAQAQGKFWEMHDRLYANFRSISKARILTWAQEMGLDVTRFKTDLDSHKYLARVTAEEKQGEDAGVSRNSHVLYQREEAEFLFRIRNHRSSDSGGDEKEVVSRLTREGLRLQPSLRGRNPRSPRI